MVSHAAELGGLKPVGQKSFQQDLDRWIFVFTAALVVVTILAGFIPSSIQKISEVQAGQRAAFLPVLHVHAVFMGTWIALLVTQSVLVATNNHRLHQRLGIAGVALMPAMVVTGFFLVPATFRMIWSLDPAIVPPPAIADLKVQISNISLAQIRIGILFAVYVALALYLRKSDSETHKRLMILATVLPLPAAIDRIVWLPNTMPDSPLAPDFYIVLLILPMFAYDLFRHKKIQRAYVYWVIGWLPTAIIINLLWNSPWWLATAPRLMGVES